MGKKITVTLSDKAEAYFDEIMFTLETPKGPATQSEAINESLESLADFEKCTDDQLVNWLMDNYGYPARTPGRIIGLKDGRGKWVCEGDMYYEEIPEDDGDARLFYVVKWIKEWAMFAMLSMGEIPDYEDNGVSALDDSSRNTFILDEGEFAKMHFKGNVNTNPELMEMQNKQSFE